MLEASGKVGRPATKNEIGGRVLGFAASHDSLALRTRPERIRTRVSLTTRLRTPPRPHPAANSHQNDHDDPDPRRIAGRPPRCPRDPQEAVQGCKSHHRDQELALLLELGLGPGHCPRPSQGRRVVLASRIHPHAVPQGILGACHRHRGALRFREQDGRGCRARGQRHPRLLVRPTRPGDRLPLRRPRHAVEGVGQLRGRPRLRPRDGRQGPGRPAHRGGRGRRHRHRGRRRAGARVRQDQGDRAAVLGRQAGQRPQPRGGGGQRAREARRSHQVRRPRGRGPVHGPGQDGRGAGQRRDHRDGPVPADHGPGPQHRVHPRAVPQLRPGQPHRARRRVPAGAGRRRRVGLRRHREQAARRLHDHAGAGQDGGQECRRRPAGGEAERAQGHASGHLCVLHRPLPRCGPDEQQDQAAESDGLGRQGTAAGDELCSGLYQWQYCLRGQLLRYSQYKNAGYSV